MIQTIPKAELTGILDALIFVRFPQDIVTDDAKHVSTIRKIMARGIRHIGRMDPLLDLWRMVYEAMNTKVGIHEHEDEYKLIVEWIEGSSESSP